MRGRILSDPNNVYRIRPGFRRNSSESDKIRVGFRLKGIRQQPYWIRSVFYGRCRIPTKSDSDPIVSDWIYRSDWITWETKKHRSSAILADAIANPFILVIL